MGVQVPLQLFFYIDMAAQRREHTQEQVRGLLESTTLHKCPECSEKKAKVIESRKVQEGVRRRYECGACNNRFTLVEIGIDAYNEFKTLKTKYSQVCAITNGKSSSNNLVYTIDDNTILCDSCEFYLSGKCAFDLPEAGQESSKGCNLFQPNFRQMN